MNTVQPSTVQSKINTVTSNISGILQFLKVMAQYSLYNPDTWQKDIQPVQEKFKEFLAIRGASETSLKDLIQYGPLFIGTIERFFRAEHIQQNVALTEKEKRELEEELTEAFSDEKDREQIALYGTAVGSFIRDLLVPTVDMQIVQERVSKKLEELRPNLENLEIAETIVNKTTVVNKLNLLINHLEDAGVTIDLNGEVKISNESTRKQVENHPVEPLEKIILQELESLKDPLTQLLLSCDRTKRF
jgi:hypothetical protein